MYKKKKQITDLQFKIGVVVILILIIGLFYFGFIEDRFIVKEDNFNQELFINGYLDYETEFCANRLTELAQEYYFLESKIKTEKNFLVKKSDNQNLREQEQKITLIEQRELQKVKEEFETYSKNCIQFDENPTIELCADFLQEAKDSLDVAKKNADESTGFEHVKITIKDLRNANRIYEGLQEVCNNK